MAFVKFRMKLFPFISAEDGESDEQVVLVSQSGTVNRIKVRDISIQSRFARLEVKKLPLCVFMLEAYFLDKKITKYLALVTS